MLVWVIKAVYWCANKGYKKIVNDTVPPTLKSRDKCAFKKIRKMNLYLSGGKKNTKQLKLFPKKKI